MLQENGIHNSYEKPPDVPPFTERRPKKVKASATSTSCGETFVQMAEAFTSVLNRPSEPQPKPEGTQKACNVSHKWGIQITTIQEGEY